jgi:Domain of unknown function (DUF4512)
MPLDFYASLLQVKMVCVPCFLIPILLFLWHKFLQPMVLMFWNPWKVEEQKKGEGEEAKKLDEKTPTCPFSGAANSSPATVAVGDNDSSVKSKDD